VRALTALPILFLGCSGPKYDYGGFSTHKYFPLDGSQRSWTFYTDAETWLLHAEMLTPHQREGSTSIATIEYTRTDPYALLYTVKWSSDSSNGIQIHGYSQESDGSSSGGDDTASGSDDTGVDSVEPGTWVDFSPPISFSKFQMAAGDKVTSSTGGVTYTSTFEEVEKCPNNWATETWDCLRFVLESSSSTDVPPFVGTWWLATDWGPSWFQPPGLSDPWVLTEAKWSE